MSRQVTDDDDDVPETVSLTVVRCPGCGNVHIEMLDDDGETISEMTLDDSDLIKLGVSLLRTVFPTLSVERLTEQVKAAAAGLH